MNAAAAAEKMKRAIRDAAVQAIAEFHEETGLSVGGVQIGMIRADCYSKVGHRRASLVGEIDVDIRG